MGAATSRWSQPGSNRRFPACKAKRGLRDIARGRPFYGLASRKSEVCVVVAGDCRADGRSCGVMDGRWTRWPGLKDSSENSREGGWSLARRERGDDHAMRRDAACRPPGPAADAVGPPRPRGAAPTASALPPDSPIRAIGRRRLQVLALRAKAVKPAELGLLRRCHRELSCKRQRRRYSCSPIGCNGCGEPSKGLSPDACARRAGPVSAISTSGKLFAPRRQGGEVLSAAPLTCEAL